jgi:hypothetical protein
VKILTREEALTVDRSESLGQPWVWPYPICVMISDTARFAIGGTFNSSPADDAKYGRVAKGGDPLEMAIALEMVRLLYDHGYALVKLDASEQEVHAR